MPKLVVISFILARPVTFVSVVEGIIRMKKIYKRANLLMMEFSNEHLRKTIVSLKLLCK
jgi:uncharacterized protein YjeT (DUF2065 family)